MFLPQICVTQENDLQKYWVMNNAFDCKGNVLNRMDESYWNVDFRSNSIALIYFSKTLKIEKKYTLIDNKLNLEFEEFTITKITKDTLVLSTTKKSCVNYVFLSKEANILYDQRRKENLIEQNNKFFIHNGDSIYLANSYNSPKMKKYPNHMEYFIKAFPNMNKTKGCVFKLQFIVQKDGKLSDSRGSISCLKKSDKKVSQIIKDMEDEWQPMYINGNPVNSLMRVRIKHN